MNTIHNLPPEPSGDFTHTYVRNTYPELYSIAIAYLNNLINTVTPNACTPDPLTARTIESRYEELENYIFHYHSTNSEAYMELENLYYDLHARIGFVVPDSELSHDFQPG